MGADTLDDNRKLTDKIEALRRGQKAEIERADMAEAIIEECRCIVDDEARRLNRLSEEARARGDMTMVYKHNTAWHSVAAIGDKIAAIKGIPTQ